MFREPATTGLFLGTLTVWLLSELRIVVGHRGGTGEDLDRGSRVWVVLLTGAGMAAAAALARTDTAGVAALPAAIVGAVLALGGIALRQWSVATLGAFFTISVEVQPGHRIIERGPYALVRHPSYAGTLATVVGLSLALGNLLGCTAASVLCAGGLVQRILVEERALASRLGPAWTAFAATRKRLIPLVW